MRYYTASGKSGLYDGLEWSRLNRKSRFKKRQIIAGCDAPCLHLPSGAEDLIPGGRPDLVAKVVQAG